VNVVDVFMQHGMQNVSSQQLIEQKAII